MSNNEFFVFLNESDKHDVIRQGFITTRHVRSRENAQKAIDTGHLGNGRPATTLYRLVPVSLVEEPITVTKKVIP